jgi:hypothetical protein
MHHKENMKNAKYYTPRIAAALIMLTCLTVSAVSVFAGPKNNAGKDLIISFNEYFTGPSTIDGTSVIAGAFSDKGSRHQDNTIVSQSADGSQVVVTGTVTINGTNGVFTSQYTGTIYLNATNIAYIEGTESITGGTGAYTGAAGKGTFEATIDFDTGNIVGVAELKLK